MSSIRPESDSDPPELDPTPEAPSESFVPPSSRPDPVDDPIGELPRLARRHARLAMRLRRAERSFRPLFDELSGMLGDAIRPDEVDVIPRASGLRRPGAIAQLGWPRLGTRVGMGIDPAVAHAIVDRLLGFERTEPEHKRQVSPVEWGVLGFVVARLLDRLGDRPGVLGPWDLYVDRVGPEPFQPEGLGPVVTLAWPIRVSPSSGIVRLWVPEMLVALVLVDEPSPPPLPSDPAGLPGRLGALQAVGVAELARLVHRSGLAGLRPGITLPIGGEAGAGSPDTPQGPVALVFGDDARRWVLPSAAVPGFGGSRLAIQGPISRHESPQEAIPVPPSNDANAPAPEATPAADVPVTLVVELGRLAVPLARLADVKPGDVLELARNARDPIDLTSGGTLVARGELVQLDSGLGVRVTRVFL